MKKRLTSLLFLDRALPPAGSMDSVANSPSKLLNAGSRRIRVKRWKASLPRPALKPATRSDQTQRENLPLCPMKEQGFSQATFWIISGVQPR